MHALIGRQREVAAGVRHLAAVTDGAARLLLLEGLAGIGKTSVLDAISAQLGASGLRTVRVSLTAAETVLSWAGLISLCGQLRSEAREQLPSAQREALVAALGGEGPREVEPMLVAAALAGLVAAEVAEHAPLLVVVDDVHWLDHASASALAFAIRSVASLPVAFAIASRPERRPLEPERLLAGDRTLRLGLEGMSLIDLQELLAERFGVVHRRPDLIRLLDACGGNVLHAIEIGRMLSAGHTLDEALVPPTLQAAVDGDLARLPAHVLEVLELVALLARPTIGLVERARTGSEAALADAEAAGVIRERDGRLEFAHPLIRAGLLDRLGGVRRRRLERHLAEAVDDPEERVLLLAAATVEPDETIAAALAEVADLAQARGAADIAAARYDRAVALTPAGHPARPGRLLRAGLAYTRAGDAERAHPRYEEAIAAGLPAQLEAMAVNGLAVTVAGTLGPSGASEVLQVAAERLRRDPAARLWLLSRLAVAQLFDDVRTAAATAALAAQEARASSDDQGVVAADVMLAVTHVLASEPVDVEALQRKAAGLSGTDANVTPQVYLDSLLVWTDHLADAIAAEEAELQRAVASGHVPAEANALHNIADAYRRCGRWDQTEAALNRWVELTSLIGHDPTTEGTCADIVWLHAARGRLEEAASLAVTVVEHTKAAPIWQLQAMAHSGFAARLRGDLDLAQEHLEAACRLADEIGFEDLGALPFRDEAVEVLVATGRVTEAAIEVARMTERAQRAGRPRGLAMAARARGLVATANGDLPAAAAAMAEALTALAALDDPFELARVLQLSGTVARRAGRRTEAREQLDEARRLFAGLRAVPFVERVDAELQRLGERTGRTDLLTSGERQVAELVCDGRTNADIAAALFVTVRTVEAHLTRVYRKLGVRSRAELIARRSLLEQ